MEHLSKDQIAELRSDLVLGRDRAIKQLAALTESAKPVELSSPIGRLSRMDALQQQGLAQKQQASIKTLLAKIEAALKRIDAGTYGVCLKSGDPIAFSRLKAMPENAIGMIKPEDDSED